VVNVVLIQLQAVPLPVLYSLNPWNHWNWNLWNPAWMQMIACMQNREKIIMIMMKVYKRNKQTCDHISNYMQYVGQVWIWQRKNRKITEDN